MKPNSISYHVTDRGIAIVLFNCPDNSQNRISKTFLQRLYLVLTGIKDDKDVKGVILKSAKSASFLDHVELKEMQDLHSYAEAHNFALFAQHVIQALHKLNVPTLAAIHGSCSSAGLEIALACKNRICSFSPQTNFGFDYTKIGLPPFMGATKSLPELVGLRTALELILTGKTLNPDEARLCGLVDRTVHELDLDSAARDYMTHLMSVEQPSLLSKTWSTLSSLDLSAGWDLLHDRNLNNYLRENNYLARLLSSQQTLAQFKSKTLSKYSAILSIIDSAQRAFSANMDEALTLEADCFARLINDRVTRNLIFLHKLKEDFFKENETRKRSSYSLKDKPTTSILGAGLRGGTVAGLFAAAGSKVRLFDHKIEQLSKALKAARNVVEQLTGTGTSTPVEQTLSLISTTRDLSGIKQADYVIDSLPEDLDVKKSMYNKIVPLLRADTLLFTLSSTLFFHDLANASERPDRFLGLQFLPPVEKNPLVEVVTNIKTDPKSVDKTFMLMERLQKIPFQVKDSPGYLINRVQGPYLIEALLLLEEGVRPDEIEKIMLQFGMESGPFRTVDEIGLDRAFAIGESLYYQLGERFRVPRTLKNLIEKGKRGKSNKNGFYIYSDDNQALELDPKISKMVISYSVYHKKPSPAEIEQRLVFMLLNETARCVEEKVAQSHRHIDLAMVFAKLFPAFLGGPLRYIDSIGCQDLVRHMDKLAVSWGERFEPAVILTELSSRNGKFYS